jgi:AraC family transcriptional regulator of adaptative response / DNA-3-methyladenine glycosylase II
MLEENPAGCGGPAAIASRLGCTERHLRRVFEEEYHVTPAAFLRTRRLLLAKSLLADTALPVLDVAMAAGFGSLRRLNALLKERYGLTPTALRGRGAKAGAGLQAALGYRPPYRWEAILGFFAQRAVAGVESVSDGEYRRTVRLQAADGARLEGWLRVKDDPARSRLAVIMSESLLPALPLALARTARQFDTRCDPKAVHAALSPMNAIRPGLCLIGTRLPGAFDAFETAVRAVLGQQISVKAAATLAARLAEYLGTPVETGLAGLTRSFPSAGDLLAIGGELEGRLGALGVTSARSRTIRQLARAFADGSINFDYPADPEAEAGKLTAIAGVGGWTANYVAMRAMGHVDAFLETDHGVKRALSPLTPRESLDLAEAWRPWRAYATINLWNSLGGGTDARLIIRKQL